MSYEGFGVGRLIFFGIRMKVLHINLGLGNGGAEGALFRLATSDSKNSHVVISIMGDGVYGEKLRLAGIELHSFNVPRGKIKLSAIIKTYQLIKKIQPDVVQTWLYHADLLGGVLAKLAGVKGIVWGIRHSNLEPGLNSKFTIMMAKLSALLSGLVPSRVISCSIKAAEVHKKIGYKSDIMTVIPNGYDLDLLKFSEQSRKRFRTQWELTDHDIVFGMIGRWTPLKDHRNLFSALSILKKTENFSFKCVLVGPHIDESNSELVGLIKEYNIEDSVVLAGSSSDVSGPLSGFDVFVLSSAGEAFPNVVAESMACETPCVVTDVGDAAYIVGDWGVVVPPGNSQALANGLLQAVREIKDTSQWQTKRLGCRARILENFSIGSMTKSFVEVWKSTLGK